MNNAITNLLLSHHHHRVLWILFLTTLLLFFLAMTVADFDKADSNSPQPSAEELILKIQMQGGKQ